MQYKINTYPEIWWSTCDKMSTTYDNFLVIGDLNYDMLSPQKCTPLKNVWYFWFYKYDKEPTCFTKNVPPTLNDVILTNQSNYCQNAPRAFQTDMHNKLHKLNTAQ
jgi:hypothetical protein